MKRALVTLILAGILLNTGLYAKGEKKDDPISKEDMAKASLEIELPSPGELVVRLKKALGDIEWKSYIDLKSSKKYSQKQDLAFNLGAKGADAYFLTIAKDTTNLIETSGTIYKSMNDLKVNTKSTKKILSGLKKSLKSKKDINWQKVLEDITILKDEITVNLDKKYKEGDATILYNIGGWLEGYRLATDAIKNKYSAKDTSILIQNDLVTYLLKKLQESTQAKKFAGYSDIENVLKEIKKIVSGAKDAQLSKKDVEGLSSKLSKVQKYM
jgi:hypothetical protein